MSGRLEGQVAVVTGAGRGIGRAIATAFANEGAAVALAARNSAQLDDVAEEICAAGGNAIAQPTDVTNDDNIVALRAATTDALGPPSIVVNNAGAYAAGRFVDLDFDTFERLMQVNYLAVVKVIKAFLPDLLRAGQGSLITVASTAGKSGTALQTPYNASKHAVVGLTRSLGIELGATGVRVNAICPGFVETELVDQAVPDIASALGIEPEQALNGLLQRVPIGRLLQPEEVAHLAVYLASPESQGMTGQSLTISGGLIVA